MSKTGRVISLKCQTLIAEYYPRTRVVLEWQSSHTNIFHEIAYLK